MIVITFICLFIMILCLLLMLIAICYGHYDLFDKFAFTGLLMASCATLSLFIELIKIVINS